MDDSAFNTEWGAPLDLSYKLSLAFFKKNESNPSLKISYAQKLRLLALSRQVTHGPYQPEHADSVGLLDVVGNDRLQVWESLGDMSKQTAQLEFLNLLSSYTPLVKSYVREQAATAPSAREGSPSTDSSPVHLRKDILQSSLPEPSQEASTRSASAPDSKIPLPGATPGPDEQNHFENASQPPDSNTSPQDLLEMKAQLEQIEEERLRQRADREKMIRVLLNQQTEQTFKQYAAEQYPNDALKQAELIGQLQEQHYTQYMSSVYASQIEHQRQQRRQIAAAIRSMDRDQFSSSRTEAGASAGGARGGTGEHVLYVNEEGESQLLDRNATSVRLSLENEGEGEPDAEERTPLTSAAAPMARQPPNAAALAAAAAASASTSLSITHNPPVLAAVASAPSARKESENEGEIEHEQDMDEFSDDEMDPDVIMPEIMPASMWTRKDIQVFKKDILKNHRECCIKVGSLSCCTVRVPTHPDGSSIYWEFATDSYDIGFGVHFEWTLEPGDRITVQTSDSEDDDEGEGEGEEGPSAAASADTGSQADHSEVEIRSGPSGLPSTSLKPLGGREADPEKGGARAGADGRALDEIVPIYRRDSHEEVYCGSHSYPGRGVYLLKFDNSYSMWRSKWLYYRVFYGK